MFCECWRLGIPLQGLTHDLSKFLPSEWFPYVESFYGGHGKDRPQWVKDAFDVAWMAHIHKNPHHWQHHILVYDNDGTTILKMPNRYMREMLADWRGAGRAITGEDNTKEWYRGKRQKTILLHPETRAWIEEELGLR